jgi:hypothetical protein
MDHRSFWIFILQQNLLRYSAVACLKLAEEARLYSVSVQTIQFGIPASFLEHLVLQLAASLLGYPLFLQFSLQINASSETFCDSMPQCFIAHLTGRPLKDLGDILDLRIPLAMPPLQIMHQRSTFSGAAQLNFYFLERNRGHPHEVLCQ